MERFDGAIDSGRVAFIWPESSESQMTNIYLPPFQTVLKAVMGGLEFSIVTEVPDGEGLYGDAGEALTRVQYSTIRALGVSAHVSFYANPDGVVRYDGIMPDGTPISFTWDGADE